MRRSRALLGPPFFALALCLAACGGDDDGSGDGADAGVGDAAVDASLLEYLPCPAATDVGGFEIERTDTFTDVDGRVYDEVSPLDLLDTLATEGSCQLLRAPVLFCDPGCGGLETCGPDGTCVPFPRGQDVGTVTVRGLSAAVTMPPVAPGFFYTSPDTLPPPGFAPGDAIELHASGGPGDPFTLRGVGVAPIEGTPESVTVEREAGVAISWDAPASTDAVRIEIALNINQHGLTGSRIFCDVPDTGTFTVPSVLVTALFDDGMSGFPSLTLRRHSTDSTQRAGRCLELQVLTVAEVEVEIAGLTSCNDDEDCPNEEECQSDLTCAPEKKD